MLKSEHLSLTLRQHPWSQPSYNSLLIELLASAFSLLQSILNTALRDTVKKEIRSRHSSARNPLIEIYLTLSKSPDHSWALNNVASPCSVDLSSCCSLPCSPPAPATRNSLLFLECPRHPLCPALSTYCLLWLECSSPRHPQISLAFALWVNVTLSMSPSLATLFKLSNTHSPNSLFTSLLYFLHGGYYHLTNIPYFYLFSFIPM